MALAGKDLVYGLKSVSDPQISPDAEWVVYGVTEISGETHKRIGHLWISRRDGSEARPLTTVGEQNSAARWSPDGRSLAFSSDRDGKQALFVLSLDGGEAHKLVTHPNGIGPVHWSPDGAKLAYTAEIDPEHPEDEEQKEGAPAPIRHTDRADYKYDGRGYLGDKRGQVFIYDLAAGQERQLTTGPDEHDAPRWSPDGQRLLTAQWVANTGRFRLAVIDAERGEVRAGPLCSSFAEARAWSLDGQRILHCAQPAGRIHSEFEWLDSETGEQSPVTTGLHVVPPFDPAHLVWLGDRQVLMPVIARAGSALALLDTETGDVQEDVRWEAEHEGFSTDRTGRYVAQVRQEFNTQDEVVVHDRETGEMRQITQLNDAAVEALPGLTAERFTIERNGHAIDAWLLKPADFDEAKQYPLVLDIHGGPAWWWGYRFEYLHRMLISRGFLVLFANPRGSHSYGPEFVQAVIEDWGGEDYLDLMAVMDDVTSRPYVDKGRTGVYGYSYGGFMTSWIIGHTDRFKAAVIGAPVSDLISFFGTSDIGFVWGPTQFGKTPWENRDWYIEHSPITHLHKATTPSLVLVSEGDDRCPVGQAEQVFTMLKKVGVEAALVRYPGGSHALPWYGHPVYMADYFDRVSDWFEQRL